MIFQEMKRLAVILGRLWVIVGVVIGFFFLLELVRAYHMLYSVHPVLGLTFLGILVAGLLWLAIWIWHSLRHYPRALTPPARTKTKKYAKYLARYMSRLAQNPNLPEEQCEIMQTGADRIYQASATRDMEQLELFMREIETDTLDPAMQTLDKLVDARIRSGVRDIMLAVTLSPYRSVDIMIIVYRNFVIVKDIIELYNTRPALREALAIAYDTARVVATVNFVNLGTKMMENISRGLPSMIPGVGRIADDCAQGLAAGLLTSVAGHAAKLRCRCYQRWDHEQAKATIAAHLRQFTVDVGKMFFADIGPQIQIVGGISMDKWRDLTAAVSKGFNDTFDSIGSFVRSHTPGWRQQSSK